MEELQLKAAFDDEEDATAQTEIPDIVDGKARPKTKRKYTKRAARFFKNGDMPSPVDIAKPKTAKVKFNFAKALGPEVVAQAARTPVFALDMGGTLVSKGKLAGINYIHPAQWQAIDASFLTVLDANGLEIEATPLQVWLGTCLMAYISGTIAQLADKVGHLKEEAGTMPHVQSPGSGRNGTIAPEAVPQRGGFALDTNPHGMAESVQPGSSEAPTA